MFVMIVEKNRGCARLGKSSCRRREDLRGVFKDAAIFARHAFDSFASRSAVRIHCSKVGVGGTVISLERGCWRCFSLRDAATRLHVG